MVNVPSWKRNSPKWKGENQEIIQNGNASPSNKLVESTQPRIEEQIFGEISGPEIKESIMEYSVQIQRKTKMGREKWSKAKYWKKKLKVKMACYNELQNTIDFISTEDKPEDLIDLMKGK